MVKARVLSFVVLVVVALFAIAPLAQAQATSTVQATNNPTLGQILTDSRGMTLYVFTKDTTGTSNCTGTCAQIWPPLTVPSGTTPTAGTSVTGTLATITRADGSLQVTYNGMPLYNFGQDTAAGDTKGQNVASSWFVVNPATGPVKAAPAASTPAAGAAAPAGTATPSTLPRTGGDEPAGWLLPVMAGALLLGIGALARGRAHQTQ